MLHSFLCFCQNGTAVPFINKHSLAVATFTFLRATVTEYCACRFLYFSRERSIVKTLLEFFNLSKTQANIYVY